MRFTAGDRVTVRGSRWLVEESTVFDDSTLLDLSAVNPHDTVPRCRLLVPFDRPVICARAPNVRAVSPRRWGHHLRSLLSRGRAHGQLRAAQHASIDILPFQLEPALAVIRGRTSRLLLADEVGLGKTIQAGLVLAELQHRGWCDRALIITPSGLRQQWAGELKHRFHIAATVMDAAWLSTLAASLAPQINPWTCDPVAITSIDFVKQPEVLRGVGDEVWDLLIVDEAHQAAAASLRHDAVERLASHARHLVLLTATPHAGDERAYESLCALGRFEESDRIALFRRTRSQAGLSRTRRVHLLPVCLTAEAAEMHRQLDAYLTQLWRIAGDAGKHDVRLVAMVLAKRAFSSAHSLLRSLERRVSGLGGDTDTETQPLLPFDADTDSSDEPILPAAQAFPRIEEERNVLQSLVDAARRAAKPERKMMALGRILRRVKEPVIVFTEYRDTLDAIAAAIGDLRTTTMLHGGMSATERHESVAAFTSGNATLLLATDAGSEGLNLQSTCRCVINLELPWNPIRLEQRIGRVDRMGQTRPVHAINLFAAGTAESDVLARLQERLARIQMSEIEIAACVINRSAPPPRPDVPTTHTETIELHDAAVNEAKRIGAARGMHMQRGIHDESVVPVTVLARRGSRRHADSSFHAIAFLRVRLTTRTGRLVEDMLVPVCLEISDSHWRLKRREVRAKAEALLAVAQPNLISCASEHAALRESTITNERRDWIRGAMARERRIASNAAADAAPFVQAGLFDSRAIRRHVEMGRRIEAIRENAVTRTSALEAESTVFLPQDPEILLLLIAHSRFAVSGWPCCRE